MKIFESAKVRLTAWYLLIIAFIVIIFSLFIYRNVTSELEDSFRGAEMRLRSQTNVLVPKKITLFLLADEYVKARHAVLLRLLAVDAFIISISGIAAYLLAGKTLKPLESAIEEQKRFVADASHELRTPLTAMKSEIEVTLRDKNFNVRDSKSLLKSNLEEVDKMQQLTNYLLALNRYESGNKKLIKESFDLDLLVKQVVQKHKAVALKKRINLATKTQANSIKANKVSIEELLSILIDNAIKYTPEEGKIDVIVKKVGRRSILLVKDTGIGIKATELPYIFNRFFRADSSRSKIKTDGYGLGLSIAKSIVDLNSGKIEVNSSQSKGTTFTVTFK